MKLVGLERRSEGVTLKGMVDVWEANIEIDAQDFSGLIRKVLKPSIVAHAILLPYYLLTQGRSSDDDQLPH